MTKFRTVFLAIALAHLLSASALAQSGDRFFKTSGPEILDRSGSPVVMRGVGLGGWLMPEGYMLHISAPDGGSPTSIRSQIEALVGTTNANLFYEKYRANYVEEKDIAAIAEWGFDHIRLPFHYNIFFDPDTETFREDGFTLLDTFLDWCRTHGLDVILDMHAAPGAQNDGNISDSDGVARLWTEPVPYQDQTVDIWKEIATRYASDTLIVGYDLINEPVTPDGVSGFDLRDLHVRIADSIRTVDSNHILFIEGNFFATHFPEQIPPFDDNMVYTFHKYWNGTAVNSIQYLLDIRSDNNVPLWLGETGENSNPWYYRVVELMDEHRIGWNYWTHKKIRTTTSPVSAPFAPDYEDVVEYWRGNGPAPAPLVARGALLAMAEGLDLDSTIVRRGVLAALFDSTFGTLRKPFAEHTIPGDVNAADYDIGNNGVTYNDTDVMATSGSPGGGNTGAHYRNDGVDIEPSTDPQGYEYNVGWTHIFEWLTYTVNVETTGTYDVEVRVASDVGGGIFDLRMNDVAIGDDLEVANTGGWQNWTSVWLRDVDLTAGEQILKLLVKAGDFNLNRMKFHLVAATSSESVELPSPNLTVLSQYPNPFDKELHIDFELDSNGVLDVEVVDLTGRRVYSESALPYQAGRHTLTRNLGIAPGSYVVRLTFAGLRGQQSASFSVIRMP